MQYIILDMEWNQAWPGSSAARQPLPSPMRGEIVRHAFISRNGSHRLCKSLLKTGSGGLTQIQTQPVVG